VLSESASVSEQLQAQTNDNEIMQTEHVRDRQCPQK
jgi:hypothetical protein